MLGKKQAITNEDWLTALATIEQAVSKEEVDRLLSQTTADILRTALTHPNMAFGWSGGKDSEVLRFICERAGIKQSVFVRCNLEVPSFCDWVEEHKPAGLVTINTEQDLPWLAKHPEMLFPREGKYLARWYAIVQHRGQRAFFRDQKLDLLVLGRRRADGNFTGPADTHIYRDRFDCVRYSPLAAWRHEDVLAVMHYYRDALHIAPIYDWPRGFRVGTGPWPSRPDCANVAEGWREVFAIDPNIVREAAELIPSAKTFLEVSAQ